MLRAREPDGRTASSSGTGSAPLGSLLPETAGAGPRAAAADAWSLRATRRMGRPTVPRPPFPGRRVRRGEGAAGRTARRTGRPTTRAESWADALAVLDATGTERAPVVGIHRAHSADSLLAANHPDRVTASPSLSRPRPSRLADRPPHRGHSTSTDELDTYEGWASSTRHYWRRDYRDFVEFFMARSSPSRTRRSSPRTRVGWGARDRPRDADRDRRRGSADDTEDRDLSRGCRCPTLVDPRRRGRAPAVARGSALTPDDGRAAGHPRGRRHSPRCATRCASTCCSRLPAPGAPPPRGLAPGADPQPARALFVSSPIGLGHAQRDLAIARELRALRPRPRDRVARPGSGDARCSRRAGERDPPRHALLAGESRPHRAEAGEHDLHVFQALARHGRDPARELHGLPRRRARRAYDLWIGDEAWEVDYFLHENPELKTAPYALLTDFVGWLPMPAGGEREAFVAADYNAREHRARRALPARARPRAVRRQPADVVAGTFGPGLPVIPDWIERHFEFTGLRAAVRSRRLRRPGARCARELGYGPTSRSGGRRVGGSGVGATCCSADRRRPGCARRVPDAAPGRWCAGPRIDPAALAGRRDVRCVGYVHDLFRTLAVLRPGRRAGRPDDDDGAGREPAPVLYVPAARPLRAEPPRRATGCGATARRRRRRTTRRRPRRSPRRCASGSARRSTTCRSRRAARAGGAGDRARARGSEQLGDQAAARAAPSARRAGSRRAA